MPVYAGAHIAGKRDLADICSLGARWLRFADCVKESPEILLEVSFGEAGLPQTGMNDAGFLDAEFDLAALGRLHRFSDVWSHGAKLRVRHQALWIKHLAETANQTHHVQRRDDAIEIDGTALDGFQKIFRTHAVSASGRCIGRLFVTRKKSDAQ